MKTPHGCYAASVWGQDHYLSPCSDLFIRKPLYGRVQRPSVCHRLRGVSIRHKKQSVMHELSRELDGLESGWMDENGLARVWRLSECEHVVDVGYDGKVWIWFMRSSATEHLYRIEFIHDRGRYCYSGVSRVTCDNMKAEVLRHDVDTYRAHFGDPLVG